METRKIIAIALLIGSVLSATFLFYGYQLLKSPNILVGKSEPAYIYISNGDSFKDLQNQLYDRDIVNDAVAFSFVAKLMKLPASLKPGKYKLEPNMNNRQAIAIFRSGNQTAVNITFNNLRFLKDLPAKITDKLEMDSSQLAQALSDTVLMQKFGFDQANYKSMFIPNTYSVYWDLSPEELIERMNYEYRQFWTDQRKAKADSLGLSLQEVSTLASIVYAESKKSDEYPRIAGVYYNRLQKRMHLDADPTLVYAHGDFGIKRVLNKHKEIDSPYNTYRNYGLPPGPINMPSITAIDGVLNLEQHKYLYFCASEDFSGYHKFATNLTDHLNNARRFQNALNRARIYK
ncbi:endolytic transglycosylase MltG [Persicobacter sp. CCB-QB2]|uniref:endolytic transglycosylase MltG n=1 Tax=Persicobacter sp. CCB-QB2 TaxID=1561025 RepID=UPI0006A9735B|nr:endolytic transglycosylase MltG [Persicobacter sp. CCB-QB2]